MNNSNMRSYVQQSLQHLLEYAASESERILHHSNDLCPILFTVRNGFLFVHAPALCGEPQAMYDFLATSRLICVSQDSEAAVMVMKILVYLDGQNSECSTPSDTKREFLVLAGEGIHGVGESRVLSIERGPDGRFTRLAQDISAAHPPVLDFELLPKTPPTQEARDRAIKQVEKYGYHLVLQSKPHEKLTHN